ncbi:MAG: SDR family NAD(P)-dependent oxidoreductase [Acidimicrobiales bacterium]
MNRFGGVAALVVGGGSDGPARGVEDVPLGNGRAIAMRLASEGAEVAVTDVNSESAEATVEAMGSGLAITADAADPEACRGAVATAESRLGRLDVVVLNVGISGWQKIKTQTVEDWQTTVDVNVTSNWVTAQAALPAMIDRGHGVFVFVTSLAAVVSSGNSVAYEATKSAQLGVMRHVAVRYADRGIRSNALVLGVIDSTMVRKAFGNTGGDHESRDSMAPMGRQGRPEEAAAAAAFLASDDATYITGTSLVVDGGITAAL